MMSENVLQYVQSDYYAGDFRVVREAWTAPRILGGAGMFIFTTYATLPLLTTVGSAEGNDEALMLRKVTGVGREKIFLMRVLGLAEDELAGGLANPSVRTMLTGLGERHRELRGMRMEYLDFFAGVIAISCLRVRATLGSTFDAVDDGRYWRYMRHSLALLGAKLGQRGATLDSCAGFVAQHTAVSQRTDTYIGHLLSTYPDHMMTCASALFPETRRMVARAMAGKLPAGWR
jgi:hypothetical protein